MNDQTSAALQAASGLTLTRPKRSSHSRTRAEDRSEVWSLRIAVTHARDPARAERRGATLRSSQQRSGSSSQRRPPHPPAAPPPPPAGPPPPPGTAGPPPT